jgi:co-chaperonin GroES (HSP10)
MQLSATLDNVIYKKLPQPPQSDTIVLTNRLQMSTEWAVVKTVGPDSILQPDDEILISSRPSSFTFEVEDEILHNIEDKSCIAYKRNGKLQCTVGHILCFEPPKEEEKFSTGGILLATSVKPKIDETIWLTVAAAGPKSGVREGDSILVKNELEKYPLTIDGINYRNIGMEQVVCYRR